MKRNYLSCFSNKAQASGQEIEITRAQPGYLAFLKYRLSQLGHFLPFNDARLQQPSYPEIKRVPMKGQNWDECDAGKVTTGVNLRASIRRNLMFLLILMQTFMGTAYLASLLPYQGWSQINFIEAWNVNPELALTNVFPYIIQTIILILFAILFCWISIGFWTSIMGLIVHLFGRERSAIAIPSDLNAHLNKTHRTALVMPICNESVERVFSGLQATYQSLVKTGQANCCDFYLLSDTSDPDLYVNELKAWADFNGKKENNGCHIYYRHRKRRVKRKSGNIDDFCRRWGSQYEYMMILDADSIMTGDAILQLITMMELTPTAGIIQSPPKSVRMTTLYGRIQQFANQIYSDIFCAGTHFWQLSEAQYWGHNAIIRLKPFIKHCILSPIPNRKAPIPILSHDLVEAVLMRRAGYGVWIAYNLQGSYEELPGNMIEDLKRDNRWCMGNLINLRLIFKRGITLTHRVMLMTSGMAYISSILWLAFLLFSTLLLLVFNVSEPHYFLRPNQFYPVWPRWDEHLAMQLLSTTLVLLFAPKVFSYFIILCTRKARSVGGIFAFTCSLLFEMVWSVILAPIRMVFHSTFVIKALIGRKIQWKSPSRSDDALTWKESFYFCWHLSLLGVIWLAVIIGLNPQFTYWYFAILVPLIISPLIMRISGLSSIGLLAKKGGLFFTPEETLPSKAVTETGVILTQIKPKLVKHGFVMAVVDPLYNGLVCAISTSRHHTKRANEQTRQKMIHRFTNTNLLSIDEQQKLSILEDPIVLSALHMHVWQQQEKYDKLFSIWQNERNTFQEH